MNYKKYDKIEKSVYTKTTWVSIPLIIAQTALKRIGKGKNTSKGTKKSQNSIEVKNAIIFSKEACSQQK